MTGTEAYRRAPPTISNPKSHTKSRQQAAPDGLTGHTKVARGALITTSLPSLQNLIKRSSESYGEEFVVQWNRWGSLVAIARTGLKGAKGDDDKLRELTGFICQVCTTHHAVFARVGADAGSAGGASVPNPDRIAPRHSHRPPPRFRLDKQPGDSIDGRNWRHWRRRAA